jgi:hypothetical protein
MHCLHPSASLLLHRDCLDSSPTILPLLRTFHCSPSFLTPAFPLSPSILLSCTCCPCLVHCDSIANSSARPSACVCCSSIHSCSSRNTTSSPSLSINDVRLPQPPCRAQFSSPALSDPSHRHLSSRASICCSIVINRCSARRSIFMSLCGQLRSDAVTRRQNDLT